MSEGEGCKESWSRAHSQGDKLEQVIEKCASGLCVKKLSEKTLHVFR